MRRCIEAIWILSIKSRLFLALESCHEAVIPIQYPFWTRGSWFARLVI
jgi:hypothetical protein